jgi:hypothetical protein
MCGESREKHKRKREGVYCKLFSIVSFLFLEIKQCVLSPPSVSKPPPVVSPTNKNIFYLITKHTNDKVFLGR